MFTTTSELGNQVHEPTTAPEENSPATAQEVFLACQQAFDTWFDQHQQSLQLPSLAIPREALPGLIPLRVFEAAENPSHVRLVIAHSTSSDDRDIVRVMAIEKDYSHPLSNQQDYQAWVEAKNATSSNPGIRIVQPPPSSLNRLHRENIHLIESGTITLQDRILFEVQLTYQKIPGSIPAVNVTRFDGETGLGIASDFYKNTLPNLARKMGFRFIKGTNNPSFSPNNLAFFTDKIGRSLGSAIKQDKFSQIFPYESQTDPALTVQFLYPEDKAVYLERSRDNQTLGPAPTN